MVPTAPCVCRPAIVPLTVVNDDDRFYLAVRIELWRESEVPQVIAVWCVTNTVERVCTHDRSTALHSSIETHRAWVDGVIQVVENSRCHLRQEHHLLDIRTMLTNETCISYVRMSDRFPTTDGNTRVGQTTTQ